MVIAIILLVILVCVFGYTTYNLLKKNEKQEDILASYLLYMDQLSKIIEHSDERLKKIDTKGTFESDVTNSQERIRRINRAARLS